MAISLRQLYQSKSRTAVIAVGEETINVAYHPLAFTPALIDRCYDGKNTQRDAVQLFLSETVSDWDILDEAGNHNPVTIEFMNSLPIEVLEMVYSAILEDRRAPTADEKKV